MRYRVELDGLLAFIEKLLAFEQRAEMVAARVDDHVADLHSTWDGQRCLRTSRSASQLDGGGK